MIIWLIGLSGAGKSTVGRIVAERLRQNCRNLVYLDGDDLREVWGDSPGHTIEGRALNAQRISHLCHLLDSQGIHAVTAILSIFPEWQAWNRAHFSRYFEIYFDVPLETVEARDPKGIYAAARAGREKNVVGIDIPFTPPLNADLILQPPEVLEPVDAIANRILDALPSLEMAE
ncbi:MAG: adenylyl-sulfate kinase [Alphaproteobacteria bacterium]|nr:adenylyl-sulfate kinase [Alphaproteobacteria bacterium]|tara:strand:- start:4771 stop:5292 length:522 start_codon:yes stop_codon:yes gene_type:complete